MQPQLWSFAEGLAVVIRKYVQVTCITTSKIDLWVYYFYLHYAAQHLGVTKVSFEAKELLTGWR